MLIGDILVSLGGAAVDDTDDIQTVLEGHAVGQTIAAGLRARRSGRGHWVADRGAAPEGLTCANSEKLPSGCDVRPCRYSPRAHRWRRLGRHLDCRWPDC